MSTENEKKVTDEPSVFAKCGLQEIVKKTFSFVMLYLAINFIANTTHYDSISVMYLMTGTDNFIIDRGAICPDGTVSDNLVVFGQSGKWFMLPRCPANARVGL